MVGAEHSDPGGGWSGGDVLHTRRIWAPWAARGAVV